MKVKSSYIKRIRILKYCSYILISICIWACGKEEISKGHATANPSFSSPWEFSADFQGKKDEIGFIVLDHTSSSTGLIYRLEFANIPLIEDSFQLNYVAAFPAPEKPEVALYVMVDEDALGEEYIIDTLNLSESHIILDCVSNRRVAGSFSVYLRLSKSSPPKLDPSIPDSFFIENGIFNAERL